MAYRKGNTKGIGSTLSPSNESVCASTSTEDPRKREARTIPYCKKDGRRPVPVHLQEVSKRLARCLRLFQTRYRAAFEYDPEAFRAVVGRCRRQAFARRGGRPGAPNVRRALKMRAERLKPGRQTAWGPIYASCIPGYRDLSPSQRKVKQDQLRARVYALEYSRRLKNRASPS